MDAESRVVRTLIMPLQKTSLTQMPQLSITYYSHHLWVWTDWFGIKSLEVDLHYIFDLNCLKSTKIRWVGMITLNLFLQGVCLFVCFICALVFCLWEDKSYKFRFHFREPDLSLNSRKLTSWYLALVSKLSSAKPEPSSSLWLIPNKTSIFRLCSQQDQCLKVILPTNLHSQVTPPPPPHATPT